jgi:4-carboxymuconolactone decarboxylase
MTTILTQDQRLAATERIRHALGTDRIGTEPDAPPLPPRSAAAPSSAAALPIESEVEDALLLEYEVWARPSLDLKIRSFLTVATLTALGHLDQLYRHLNIALNIGITVDELYETLLHVGVYAGLPTCRNALPVARDILQARDFRADASAEDATPTMTHDQRRAARDRVCAELNIGRVGSAAEAPVLRGLPGGLFSTTMGAGVPAVTDLADLHADYGFGEVWGRPGLPLRLRSFITVAVLQSLYQTNELQIHVNNALNLGISPEELHEALAHVGLYAGYSGWHTAALIADNVVSQHSARITSVEGA